MTTHDEPITRPEPGASDVSLVQSGWRVFAEDGEELGRVTRIEDGRLVIEREGLLAPGHLIIPRDVIETEDEGAMEVRLTIDSDAADQFAGDPS